METVNKFERYEIKTILRSQLTEAEYNPRKITDKARNKLKKALKTHGLVMPVVWNEKTGNLVGGHQRLSILDDLHKGQDYNIQVSAINVDEKEEIELNTILNNPSTQGEWDIDKLVEIKELYPDMDFINDLGFEKIDLEYIFAGVDNFDSIEGLFRETQEQKKAKADIEKIKQAKKEHREKVKQQNADGTTHNIESNDYYVTIVFSNNKEKFDFMENIQKPKTEKFIKASILYDIANGKINLYQ